MGGTRTISPTVARADWTGPSLFSAELVKLQIYSIEINTLSTGPGPGNGTKKYLVSITSGKIKSKLIVNYKGKYFL